MPSACFRTLPPRFHELILQGVHRKCVTTHSASGEFRINLPPDVLAEMRRQTGSARSTMQVDGFRPGLFGRLIDLFTGRRR